jgi:hypothetical protein
MSELRDALGVASDQVAGDDGGRDRQRCLGHAVASAGGSFEAEHQPVRRVHQLPRRISGG